MINKGTIRKEILSIRNKMLPADVKSAGIIIANKFFDSEEFKKAEELLIYTSYNNEVDTYAIIKKSFEDNKKIAVPKVIDNGIMNFYYINSVNDLQPGYKGIMEPITNELLVSIHDNTLMVCPGAVFDKNLNRIGYGGGYYDRYMSNKKLFKIGLAYEFQIVESISVEEHDVKVDKIITEKRIYF